jgi:hypothetical protein
MEKSLFKRQYFTLKEQTHQVQTPSGSNWNKENHKLLLSFNKELIKILLSLLGLSLDILPQCAYSHHSRTNLKTKCHLEIFITLSSLLEI